ncbi:MAG: hypothetical protein QG635_1661 [Bacteroidota bacterium]|nr:hypothetical protein [Bacteroidota bacterium]
MTLFREDSYIIIPIFFSKSKIMMIITILISSLIIFILRTILFSIGAYRERNKKLIQKEQSENPYISIVVPARNEENNIAACIESISKNKYPSYKFEIIAVNDRSTDHTSEILSNLKQKYDNLKIIEISEEIAKKNLRGKPGALQAGIEAAKGDIVIMTDADCTVTPKWLETISENFNNPEIALVPSFTNVKGNRIFDKLQAVEWIYMHTMAMGGAGLNIILGCFGNNLSVRKNNFINIGGYEKIKFSVTEDYALMNAIAQTGAKINYVCSPDSLVSTLPCGNIKEYLSQHHRWATGGIDLGWKAVFFVGSTVAVWLGLLLSIISGNINWFITIFSARLLGDFALISPSIIKLRLKKLLKWLLPSVIFFMIIELIVPFLLLDKKIIWKGQVFRK